MSGLIFAVVAAVCGVAQAELLGRAAQRGPAPLGLLLRLGLVAAVLLLAAREGQLALAAGGWLAGFASAALVVYRRLR